jgi:hypothetical protein
MKQCVMPPWGINGVEAALPLRVIIIGKKDEKCKKCERNLRNGVFSFCIYSVYLCFFLAFWAAN